MHTFKQQYVKTRKPHICWGCATEFPKGETMKHIEQVSDGKFISSYWCDVCLEYINRYYRIDEDGYEYGSILKNDEEEWLEIKAELEKAAT